MDRLQAFRRPRNLTALILVLAAAGYAWATGGTEIWITVAPEEMRLAVGASQQMTVALKYKPRFWLRSGARSVPATVQLIAFPTAVDVAPTTTVTTEASPDAVMKVTGLRPGQEELVVAASNTPTDLKSWQTTSVTVVVTANQRSTR